MSPCHGDRDRVGMRDAACANICGRARLSGGCSFAVIGDLQRTMIWGRLAMAEQNDPERRQLLGELARTGPAFAVMVGDLVADGSSLAHWEEFDERSEVLRRSSIPVFAVPGNHEYMFGGRANLRHYFARLPHLANQNWYARQFGNLALVFSTATPSALRAVGPSKTMVRDHLEAVRGRPRGSGRRFVFLHHAPFTNSSLVKDERGTCPARFFAGISRAPKNDGHGDRTCAWLRALRPQWQSLHRHGGRRRPEISRCSKVKNDGTWTTGTMVRPSRPFNFIELSIRDSGLHGYVVGCQRLPRLLPNRDIRVELVDTGRKHALGTCPSGPQSPRLR